MTQPWGSPNPNAMIQPGELQVAPTAAHGLHSLTVDSGVIWNAPQGGTGGQINLPNQTVQIVDRIV